MTEKIFNKFSKELKSLRESKEISLEHIAAKTRIDLKFLTAIEEGNFDIIDEVYLRAFLREYAQCLELNGSEILEKYDSVKKGESSESIKSEIQPKEGKKKEKIKKEFDSNSKPPHSENQSDVSESFTLTDVQKKNLVYGAIALLVVIVIILSNFLFFKDDSSQIVKEQAYEDVLDDQEARYEASEVRKPERVAVNQDSLVLRIIARDTSWILVNKDDIYTEEYTMYPGVTKQIKALSKFNLTLGNSGGVSLFLNGDSLNFTGQKGRVRYLVVDESGLRVVTNRTSQNND